MEDRSCTSAFSALRATMEVCSELVSEAYAKAPDQLEMFTGELPPGHRPTDRRQRYLVSERGGDMVVALPGTTHPLDWSSNLRVQYAPVDSDMAAGSQLDPESIPSAHAGFYYRSETVPTLKLLQQAADRGCRLIFTGHSLGGAVANLCALTALNAQRKVLERAASKAEADAASRRDSSIYHDAYETAVTSDGVDQNPNHSCCSSNSDYVLPPHAALVEVLSISFASPVFANAALAQWIEKNGWEESFVNLVVPEDYCLNLFNNVLTSAPDTNSKSLRRSSSSSFKTTRRQTEYSEPQEPTEDPIPEASLDAAALHVPCVAAPAHTPGPSSRSSFSGTGTPQQPLVSAMAGKSLREIRRKRQLCFAEPPHQSAGNCSRQPAIAGAMRTTQQLEADCGEDSCLPRSPSSASLVSEGSSSSTRSWTLLAYLPQSISRSLGSWSGSSSSSRHSSSGDSTLSRLNSSVLESYLLDEHFEGWGMRHARSTMDLSCGASLCSNSDDSWDSSLCDDLDGLTAPFISSRSSQNQVQQPASGEQDLSTADAGVKVDVCDSDITAPPTKQVQQTIQKKQKAALRKSFSSASLTIFTKSHKKLLQPLSSALKVTDSVSLVRGLMPSLRSVVHASKAIASAAHVVGQKAFNIPLGALEAGLIKALRPPMYEAVGQQWILSATGLVPQHQPVTQYPKYVSDVYWHKELMLVAFKEHSIVFYKRRLLQQAGRR